MDSVTTTRVVDVHVKHLRSIGYSNLEEWMADDKRNTYIGRGGIVFIDKVRFPKVSSKYANVYKVSNNTPLENVLELYREYILPRLTASDILHLIGKNLGCWCVGEHDDYTPGISTKKLCHGHIIIDILHEYTLTGKIPKK